jgi:hypothetical protein
LQSNSLSNPLLLYSHLLSGTRKLKPKADPSQGECFFLVLSQKTSKEGLRSNLGGSRHANCAFPLGQENREFSLITRHPRLLITHIVPKD